MEEGKKVNEPIAAQGAVYRFPFFPFPDAQRKERHA